ncbi:MAG: hypothetical protein CME60_14610 [Halobacteriovoraceae bacterium]|nr:hypothetical protein [Halobacteriovoraceae bacterium]|tara:strand:+ start:148821 stop:149150 length:330 start_codon:yes stop_codon:yes gene_type:complete
MKRDRKSGVIIYIVIGMACLSSAHLWAADKKKVAGQVKKVQVVEKPMHVISFSWDATKNLYRVSMRAKAGVFWAEKKDMICLKEATKSNQSPAQIKYDVHTLKIKSCRN